MKKSILLTCCLLFGSLTSIAQQEIRQYADPNDRLVTIQPRFTDNIFVELHGGSYFSWGTNLTYRQFFKRFNPAAGLAVGKWLNPYFAPRIEFMWGKNQGQLLSPKRNYNFHSVAATGDALLSLSNIFCRYNPKRWIDVQMILGVGCEYTFGFTDASWNINKFYFNDANKLFLSLHSGLGLKFRVSQAVDLGMEGVVTFSGNTFDGGYRGKGYDGHVNIMATVGYRFLNSTGSHLMTFKGRRYMTSYHHKRPKVRKLDTEYITIVATDDKNRIQSTAYFTPDSMSLDDDVREVVREAETKFRENNSNVKIYLTVKDHFPKDLPLFLLRAKSIREELMNQYIVPAGSIMIERNPEVVRTLDPEKVAVVVYIDDKPGAVSETASESAVDIFRQPSQTRPESVKQDAKPKLTKAEKKARKASLKAEKKARKASIKKEREAYEKSVKEEKASRKASTKAEQQSRKESEKAEKQSRKESEKAEKQSRKEQKRQTKKK